MEDRAKILLEALEHLASPNWSAHADGKDAREMATYAADALDSYRSSPVRDPRVFVSDDRQTLVRLWASGEVEVARRENGALGVWGAPVTLFEEKS